MYSEIIQNLKTKEDVFKLQDEVNLLLDTIYQNIDNYDNVLTSSIRGWVFELISNEVNKEKADKETYLKGLKEELSKLNFLDLAIAFEPTNANIEHISSWVKQNLGESVIINFLYDPAIIAGAVISYKGKYLDLSLLSKFNESFEKLSLKPLHST